MGPFSNLRGSTQTKTPDDAAARAVLTMPLMAVAADGKIDPTELDQILNMWAFSPIFHAIGAERMLSLAKEIIADHRSQGAEATFAKVRAGMTPKLAEKAMCFAIRTSMADGNVSDAEFNMLAEPAARVNLPPETFNKIFEVMIMLQRRAA